MNRDKGDNMMKLTEKEIAALRQLEDGNSTEGIPGGVLGSLARKMCISAESKTRRGYNNQKVYKWKLAYLGRLWLKENPKEGELK